ncbi:MAG: DUF2225 domain-containing protein [Treponema sp.]|jgi:uncharacterized protein (DUF2225 family)|nr:DUF2225 domain-containing protein [Treponema sp.]
MASELKISFLSKEEYVCPICGAVFRREELLSGSGRLIAGALTGELRRLYEPSAKYGEVFPLVYQITVCPTCFFAAMDRDFFEVPKNAARRIQQDEVGRFEDAHQIFAKLDFRDSRDLVSGAASYYLTLRCYDFFPKEFSPTLKRGIAALRAAWLLEELDKKNPGQHYDWLAVLFKKKALFFYTQAFKLEQSGKETLGAVKNFGPDTDKNYAYEGGLYLAGLLTLKYGPRNDLNARQEGLREIKRTIAKLFGLGRSSKNKPGPLLEHARSLYDAINKELNETDV